MPVDGSMDKRKLRLGILLDSYEQPAWLYHSIARVADLDCAEFVLIVIDEDHQNAGATTSSISYKLFNAIDEKLFLRDNSATELKNLQPLFGAAGTLEVKLIGGPAGKIISPADVDKIRNHELDILININFGPLNGDILTASKSGLWEYFSKEEPHGFWEVLEERSETRMELRAFTGGSDAAQTIFSSTSLTYPFSPARNRNRSLWKSSSFLSRQIGLLDYLGEERFFTEDRRFPNNQFDKEPRQGRRTFFQKAWLLTKHISKVARETINRKVYKDSWFLMYDLSGEKATLPADYKKIIPPRSLFWADPNVVEEADGYHVFIEEYSEDTARGHISALKIDRNGNYTTPVKVLEKDYHLSFPFVFQYNKKYYMIPESAANRTIDLYECIDFPFKWEHKLCLMDNVSAVDSTLLFYQEKWWLFSGISENKEALPEVELFIFHSPDLFNPKWTPHPLNPVKSDARNARPAGRIFMRDGKLYRPSQDCSISYGYGFDLNEILVLSETEYEEKCVASVRPDWDKNILATHTYGIAGNFQIMDALALGKK